MIQPSVMLDFIFISIKFIHYFSCVVRNAPFPASFTKLKFPLAASPTAELPAATLAVPFTPTSAQSVLGIESLKAPRRCCQQQSTSSSCTICLAEIIFGKT